MARNPETAPLGALPNATVGEPRHAQNESPTRRQSRGSRSTVLFHPPAGLDATRPPLGVVGASSGVRRQVGGRPRDEVEGTEIGGSGSQVSLRHHAPVVQPVPCERTAGQLDASRLCFHSASLCFRKAPRQHHQDRADPTAKVEEPRWRTAVVGELRRRKVGRGEVIERPAMASNALKDPEVPRQVAEILTGAGNQVGRRLRRTGPGRAPARWSSSLPNDSGLAHFGLAPSRRSTTSAPQISISSSR